MHFLFFLMQCLFSRHHDKMEYSFLLLNVDIVTCTEEDIYAKDGRSCRLSKRCAGGRPS